MSTRRRSGASSPGGRATDEVFHEAPSDARREQRLARRHGPHRLDELCGRRRLEQEAARACPERVVHDAILVEGGQHEHVAREPLAHHRARGSDPVEYRHAHIHQDDVGTQLARAFHRCPAVVGLAHDLDVVLCVEDEPEAAAHERLVVREQDGGHTPLSSGRRARTAKPPEARGPASNVPPKTPTRSRMPVSPCPPPGSAGAAPSSDTSIATPSSR